MKTIFISVIICFFCMLNHWQGDPAIYLTFSKNIFNGNGLVFNAGEFSTGATSPLWAAILSIGFFFDNPPLAAKIISLIFLLGSILIFNSLLGDFKYKFLGLSIIAYFATRPSLFVYETSLLFLLLAIFIYGLKGKDIFLYLSMSLLPLVRPESVILILIPLALKKWRVLYTLFPFLIYFMIAYFEQGTLSTAESRINEILNSSWIYKKHLIRRYILFIVPFAVIGGMYYLERFKIIKASIVIAVFINLFLIYQNQGNDSFEKVTMKDLAVDFKKGEKILATEIQLKYWLDSSKVISTNGLTDNKIYKYKSLDLVIENESPDYLLVKSYERIKIPDDFYLKEARPYIGSYMLIYKRKV